MVYTIWLYTFEQLFAEYIDVFQIRSYQFINPPLTDSSNIKSETQTLFNFTNIRPRLRSTDNLQQRMLYAPLSPQHQP